MEKTLEVIEDNNNGPTGFGIVQNILSMSINEEHLESENEIVSENGSSNMANLGSDSHLTGNFTSGSSILRSQSLHSIAPSVEPMDRSRSYVDLHCFDDGAVGFSVKHYGSDSEGKVSPGHRSGSSKGSPEHRMGLYGENSPEHNLGSYGGDSPEHRLGSYKGDSPEHRSGSYKGDSPEHRSGSYGGDSPENRLGLYGEYSPERDTGSCGMHSPERGSGSDGRVSPKSAVNENIIEDSVIGNLDLRKELDREIIEEEDDNMKRIKDWINQIDLNSDMIVEELGESSLSGSRTGPISDKLGPIQAARSPADPKASVGMAMAHNYISAMNPVTASAQLSHLGLVAVPILSAFAGLRELNLSGNNIIQITAGALPKGLHGLNLSKNYISVIEGLKDLSKLRILDLSYNRISRIGHGLAACSSLRELYLVANKISEVDGLHRLLKLKILDLRNNKLSTAKGLEQLAANYTTLEAISLDGNPAQRNVGDEHLKKYLLTLLPNLVCYNRHSVKSRGKKDAITMPSHKPSRGFSGTSASGLKSRTSSRSGTNYLLKASKSRNAQLPSSSLRYSALGGNVIRRVSDMNPLRRIQSQGAMEG